MGGQFPAGENEWNFNGDMPGVTKFVVENLEEYVEYVRTTFDAPKVFFTYVCMSYPLRGGSASVVASQLAERFILT